MKFNLGAYYLMKIRDSSTLDKLRKHLYTTSTCINDSLLDGWSLPWVQNTEQELTAASSNFSIPSEEISKIQIWANQNFENGNIGWLNVFYDLNTLKTYRSFFKNLDENVKVLAIYFNENECGKLLNEFTTEGRKVGAIGLETMLSKQIEETEEGKTIGYDLIGVELSGDFHSFYCHDMAQDLKDRFGLKINDFGLFEEYKDWNNVVNYMNDDETGCEPVPWFYVKVKIFDI